MVQKHSKKVAEERMDMNEAENLLHGCYKIHGNTNKRLSNIHTPPQERDSRGNIIYFVQQVFY